MKASRILCIFLLLILAGGCQTKTDLSRVVFFYVPFQFSSNEVITIENFKEKANSIEITDRSTLVFLDKLLAKSKEGSGFDGKRVRMLIVLTPGDRSIWADADGNLLEADKQRRLDRKDFDQLGSLVSVAVATDGEMR
jgi:hypothetical protein